MNLSEDTSDKIEEEGYYIIEDTQEKQPSDPNEESQNGWKLFFNILFRPGDGWKKLKRSKITVDRFAQSCFYPILALCAILNFLELVYNPETSLQTVLTGSLFIFISFFLGYFLSIILMKVFMPSMKEIFERNYGKLFIMVSMTSLAFFSLFIIALPMMDSILIFLTLYSIYIINKGVRTLRVKDDLIVKCNVLLYLFIVGLPYLLRYLLELVFTIQQN